MIAGNVRHMDVRTPTLATFATLALATTACTHPHAAGTHRKPAPGTAPTLDEQAVMRPDSFCPYVSDDGPALVCIDVSSTGRIGAVVFDLAARSRREIPLIDVEGYDACGGDEGVRTVRPAGFAALNAELASRVYRPATPVLAWDPTPQGDSDTAPPTPPPYVKGAATLAFDEDATLVLARAGQQLEALAPRWYALSVFALDDRHVAVVSHHRLQIWDLEAPAPSCAGAARCPSHYPRTRRYLAAICDDALGDQNESYIPDLYEDASSGTLARDDFQVLAAAYDALAGAPIADAGLRDFFLGKTAAARLPAACYGRFGTMRGLLENRRWERELIERGAAGTSLDGE